MKVPKTTFCPQELSPYLSVPASQLCILFLSACKSSLCLSRLSTLPFQHKVGL